MKINSSWQGTQDTEITIRVLSSPGEPLLPGANWKVLSNGLDSEFRKAQKKVGQCCTHPSSFFSITTYCYLNTKLFFFLPLVNYHCRLYFLPLVFERDWKERFYYG